MIMNKQFSWHPQLKSFTAAPRLRTTVLTNHDDDMTIHCGWRPPINSMEIVLSSSAYSSFYALYSVRYYTRVRRCIITLALFVSFFSSYLYHAVNIGKRSYCYIVNALHTRGIEKPNRTVILSLLLLWIYSNVT